MATRDALALTEDQRALRDTVRGVLADHLPSSALRGGLKTDPGYNPKLHALLGRDLGLAGLTLPEKFGGLGLGQVEACVVHTELGRALYPGPFLPSGVAAGVLLGAGDRAVAERWLPKNIAQRRKAMFRAPFDSFHLDKAPAFVEQLLSEESLRRTGYFNAQAVAHWRRTFRELRAGSAQRTSVEMGLVGVLATQLWHHTFLDGQLADLPSLASSQ